MCLVHFTQFISNPCYHETKQRFRMGEINTRYFIKTNSVFFKFHQHMVLCTTGRIYTILTEPHIINKTTSGRRMRKKITSRQLIKADGVLFYIIPKVCYWYHGWIWHHLDPTRVMNETTSGLKVRKNYHHGTPSKPMAFYSKLYPHVVFCTIGGFCKI